MRARLDPRPPLPTRTCMRRPLPVSPSAVRRHPGYPVRRRPSAASGGGGGGWFGRHSDRPAEGHVEPAPVPPVSPPPAAFAALFRLRDRRQSAAVAVAAVAASSGCGLSRRRAAAGFRRRSPAGPCLLRARGALS